MGRINNEVLKILVEKVDGKDVILRVRIRGDEDWHFYKCTLHENDSIVFQDGQDFTAVGWDGCIVPRRMID